MGLKLFLKNMGWDGMMFTLVSSAAALAMALFGLSMIEAENKTSGMIAFGVAFTICLFGFSFCMSFVEDRLILGEGNDEKPEHEGADEEVR